MNSSAPHILGHERERQPIRYSRATRATRCLGRRIRECDRKLRYLREAIGHTDATLSLFDPNGDLKEITAKRPYKRVKLFASGKLGRLVLDDLRRGARPMTTREIVVCIVKKVGYGADAAKACRIASGRTCTIEEGLERVAKSGDREIGSMKVTPCNACAVVLRPSPPALTKC